MDKVCNVTVTSKHYDDVLNYANKLMDGDEKTENFIYVKVPEHLAKEKKELTLNFDVDQGKYVTMEVPEHLVEDVEEYIMDCLAEEMDCSTTEEFGSLTDSFVEEEDGIAANSDSEYEPSANESD
jgi:hypothetical protein